ncbi:hypothetical protein O0L34_g18671 [Tuta absoluta]|nr:hypothetical protein O0L34_g18671 [Tuta absoluta]
MRSDDPEGVPGPRPRVMNTRSGSPIFNHGLPSLCARQPGPTSGSASGSGAGDSGPASGSGAGDSGPASGSGAGGSGPASGSGSGGNESSGGSASTGATGSREDSRTGFVPITFMQNMMQEMMVKLVQTTANAFNTSKPPEPRVRSLEHIYVPTFDPDDRTDTIQVWCRNLEELKTEYTLSDREILNLSRKHLRGRASEWARRNYTTVTKWPELKDGLIETFSDESRYDDDLTQFMEYTSDQTGSLAEYAMKKWELAKKVIGVEMTEQRLVEAVISGMSDFRIRSDLLRLTPKNLPQLIQSLNSYKRKKTVKDADHNIPNKRIKPNSNDLSKKHCQKCRKPGYRITVLDMAAGFHQIPIAPDFIEKTAFVTPDGQFEFLRMPFGLCNAPAVFQRAINAALKPFLDDFVLIYIDDVVIFSETPGQNLLHLQQVLDALQKSGFSLNVKKCKFLQTQIEYLGRIISNGQVRPSPGKVQALMNSPTPTSV